MLLDVCERRCAPRFRAPGAPWSFERFQSRQLKAGQSSICGHHQYAFIGSDLARSERFDMDTGSLQSLGLLRRKRLDSSDVDEGGHWEYFWNGPCNRIASQTAGTNRANDSNEEQ